MTESTEPSALEKKLESFGLPPNYITPNAYTRLQLFQADIVETMAQKEIGMGNTEIPSARALDDRHVMIVDYDPREEQIKIDVTRIKTTCSNLFRASITDPEEVERYVDSSEYRRIVKSATGRMSKLFMGHRLSDDEVKELFYDNVIPLLNMRPEDVFKKVFKQCLDDIYEASTPLKTLVGHLETGASKGLGELPECYKAFEEAYKRAEAHLEQLRS